MDDEFHTSVEKFPISFRAVWRRDTRLSGSEEPLIPSKRPEEGFDDDVDDEEEDVEETMGISMIRF